MKHPSFQIMIGFLALGFGWPRFAVPSGDADDGFGKYGLLIQRNPFLPQGGGSSMAGKPSAGNVYQFTGSVVIGNQALVGIENVGENRSYLLPIGQETDGLLVRELDEKGKRVVLVANHQTMTLPLIEIPAGLAPAASSAGASAPTSATQSQASAGSSPRHVLLPKRKRP